MNVTISHPNSSFTGTITVLETVAVGFTNGVASVDIPPQAIAVFGSMPGFSYTYGAPGPAPAYDANLDVSVNAIVGNTSSASAGTLRAAYVPAQKINPAGGYLPAPLRVPTLTVRRKWPNGRANFRVIWGSGDTAFAVDRGKVLRKTINGGIDWSVRYAPAAGQSAIGYKDCFLVLPNGDLVALRNVGSFTAPSMQPVYSTDDGNTWTNAGGVLTANAQPLGAHSLGCDANTGYLYFGEYYVSGQDSIAVVTIWRSTDNGRTWAAWRTFPGLGTSDPLRVRHIHSCQYDPVSKRMYFCIGDLNGGGGIYRATADGTDVEPILTTSQVTNYQSCAVDLMFFPNYIAWGADNSSDIGIYRMARSEIGKANPVYTKVYQINASGWWTMNASTDGTTWLLSGSNDSAGTPLDTASHLYAVTDDGATVWEVGTLSGTGSGGPLALSPVGPAGSPVFWVGSRFFSNNWSGQVSLDQGLNLNVGEPEQLPTGQPFTFNAGIDLAASEVRTIGHVQVPRQMTELFVYAMGCYKVSGTGTPKIRLVNATGNTVISGLDSGSWNAAQNTGEGAEWYIEASGLTANSAMLVQLYESTGTGGCTATGHVRFAFGYPRRSNNEWDDTFW
jgi:hypothetical protein